MAMKHTPTLKTSANTSGLRVASLQRTPQAALVRAVNIISCGPDRDALGWRRAAQASMHGVPPNGLFGGALYGA
jgi:hypothetical protein